MENIRSCASPATATCSDCAKPSVWGFLNVSGSTIPCECGTRTSQAICVCGACYMDIGTRVFTYPKNSSACPEFTLDCDVCREEAAEAALPSPTPSVTPTSTPPTASSSTKSSGGEGSTVAIAITAIVLVIFSVALALWYHGHKTKRNTRKRRRLAQREDQTTTPEPEYVVVVYPVDS